MKVLLLNYVTCSFCSSRLSVRHSGTTHSTEVLNELRQNNDSLQQEVVSLKRRAEVEQLDRQWERKRQSFLRKGKRGDVSLPDETETVPGSLVAFGFCIVLFFFSPPIAIFAGLLIGINMVAQANQKRDYQQAYRRYRRKRRDLLLQSISESSPVHVE